MSETPQRRVLLLGREPAVPLLPAILERDSLNSISAEVAGAVQEALGRIAGRGWDAVVLWADREDELAGVIRIRKASPALPILLLTSRKDPDFADLARRMGANQIASRQQDPESTSEIIRLAVLSGELAGQLKVEVERARARTGEIAGLTAENLRLSRKALDLSRKFRRPDFLPLVVEDDLDDALLMVRAFARAGISTALPILKSVEEAVTYLTEAARPESRLGLGFPSLVLLDVSLPGMSGFELLAWIRRQPEIRRLPVVVLSVSADPANVNRAYELGANSYLVKPTTFTGLVELITGLKNYWYASNQSLEL
jgi:CheY-like chemotaxis protein